MAEGEHNRFTLNAAQTADFEQMNEVVTDHYSRLNALFMTSFRAGVKQEPMQFGGFTIMRQTPDGSVSACPHCVFMLIHTLRETADVFEDVARRLDMKEPAFDQWQKPK